MAEVMKKVSPDTWIKLGMYVATGLGVAYGVKKALDYFKPEKKRENTEKKQVETELQASEKTKPASYPTSQYSAWADAIANAIYGAGTDEYTIVNIFKMLKNDTDYLKLIKAWGSPKRRVFPDFFVFYDTGYLMTLPQALREDMSTFWINKINGILKSKKIKYRI